MKFFHVKRTFAAAVMSLTVFGGSAGAVLAQGGPSSLGTTVSPPVYDLTAKAGETVTKTMTVRNDSSMTQVYTPVVNTIAPANEEGGLAFGPSSASDLSGWITVSPSSLSLAPNKTGDFTFVIKVPAGAAPGGHYATVFAMSKPTSSAGSASITTLVGTSVLLKVAGNITESASVVEFSTRRARVIPGEPIDFTVRVRNTGNVHIRPQGTIEIFRGDVKVDEIPLNADGLNVLPGNVRKFTAASNKSLPAGTYTSQLTLVYGAGQTVSVPSISFAVIGEMSLAVIVATILGIFVLILLAALMVNRRKPMMGKGRS
ncbi:hypothetical protein K8R04_01495 [Candidatus Uhrbacteria bacterium]|nr:hypothetical protein [Candidatus Uhrbacteria bacterium]